MTPVRSALYVPADKPRAIEKAHRLDPDLIILDLEDAVQPGHKEAARRNVQDALESWHWIRPVLVRVNAPSTPHFDADFEALLQSGGVSGIVLPKAQDHREVRELHLGVPLWLMIETPRGVLNADRLAGTDGVAGLIAGTNDLARELRTRAVPDRAPLTFALSQIVMAAHANGVAVLDAVYNDVRDPEGFERECVQGRDFGFDGKTVIHPDQIAAANRLFGVSEAEAQDARALLQAWEEALRAGLSVTTFRGRLVEELHAQDAQDVLKRWASQNT